MTQKVGHSQNLAQDNLESILAALQDNKNLYDRPFDIKAAMMEVGLKEGQEPSESQLYRLQVKMAIHEFKNQDQWIYVNPKNGSTGNVLTCLKHLSAVKAADIIVQKQGRLASVEEIRAYEDQHAQEKKKVDQSQARQNVGDALRTMLND